MKKPFLAILLFVLAFNANLFSQTTHKKHKILLRSSWQTINIGDIGHTPGMIALLEKQMPEAEVILWPSTVADGVREMLLRRFPNLKIINPNDKASLEKAFAECEFLLHSSGPWLVADQDVKKWVDETGKPFGVLGITLPKERATPLVVSLLNKAKFVYFRDSVSLDVAKESGVKAPVMEFGPDAAFAVDLRNDKAANEFLKANKLKKGKFVCVIPKYRRTPNWLVPNKNAAYDAVIDKRNQEMKEHDMRPYREAIIAIVRQTNMKVLICAEDVTQVALGKEMLYDPLPEDVKKRVVWRDKFWLTDEALSVYVQSAGLFGVEQHSPIMCIGNGIPALLGRYEEQTSKGYMWYNIGLGDWFFDSDKPEQMQQLNATILSVIKNKKEAKQKTLKAKALVDAKLKNAIEVLKQSIN
jgi:polysaccharide pyruvyl transferase WcaK-like protein